MLKGSTAIEGAFYDPVSKVLAAFNDRGFHDAGTDIDDPAVKNVKIHTMPSLSDSQYLCQKISSADTWESVTA